MGQLSSIPPTMIVGMVASRAWSDWSAVTRITIALQAASSRLLLGGCQAMQEAALTVARPATERYGATGSGGNAAERDALFLQHLAQDHGAFGQVTLVAFLALDDTGRRGRTHALVDQVRELGIPVVEIPAAPAGEPTCSPALARPIEAAATQVQRAEEAFDRNEHTRFALYRVALTMARRALDSALDVERRLIDQWAWLDTHPLVVDYAVREHRTLGLLATYTALNRLRADLERMVDDHAHESEWEPVFPVADGSSARLGWAS